MKDKVVSYIGIGGSDWVTRFQCDSAIQALTPAWKVINNEVFAFSTGIVMDDANVAKVHEIGVNLANAAKDIENASYKGEEGVRPHCHSRNFYLDRESIHAICCMCGIEGDIKLVDVKARFEFPEEQLKHAHDTLSGKLMHADDIKKTVAISMELKKSYEYKQRQENYKNFITATKPEK
jgi:hypothetical protein